MFRELTAAGQPPVGRRPLRSRAQREGTGTRTGVRRADVLHGRVRERDAQPEEHRHVRCRSDDAYHRHGAAGPRDAKCTVQVSVQSAFGCGFEGRCSGGSRARASSAGISMPGLTNISLADTAGHAAPDAVERLFTAIRAMDARCRTHLSFPQYLRHGNRELHRRAAGRRDIVRVVRCRTRRLPVHEGRRRQRLHRGSCAHVPADGRCARMCNSTGSLPWHARWRSTSTGTCPGWSTKQDPLASITGMTQEHTVALPASGSWT